MLSSDEGESCDASRCSNLPDKKTASIETSETEELSAQEDEPQEASESCRNMQVWKNILGENEKAQVAEINPSSRPHNPTNLN